MFEDRKLTKLFIHARLSTTYLVVPPDQTHADPENYEKGRQFPSAGLV